MRPRRVHHGVAMIPSADPATGIIGARSAYTNYGALDVATTLVVHLDSGPTTAIIYGLTHSRGGTI